MMPAKSTSDHRTYSSMIYGVAGIASRPVEPEREARVGKTPTPGSAGRRSGARGGASASVPVVAQAVGAQPAPQRRATDAKAPRGLGELPLRHCEALQHGQPLALPQRGAMLAVPQEHHFTELQRALLPRPLPSAARQELTQRSLSAAGPAALPAPGAAARRATARSTGGAAPQGSQIARPPACHERR